MYYSAVDWWSRSSLFTKTYYSGSTVSGYYDGAFCVIDTNGNTCARFSNYIEPQHIGKYNFGG